MPRVKTMMRTGMISRFIFRNTMADMVVAIRTVKRITNPYIIFPTRMVYAGQGRLLKPPIVPLSTSREKLVVRVRMLEK
jgi:hypothetical protein